MFPQSILAHCQRANLDHPGGFLLGWTWAQLSDLVGNCFMQNLASSSVVSTKSEEHRSNISTDISSVRNFGMSPSFFLVVLLETASLLFGGNSQTECIYVFRWSISLLILFRSLKNSDRMFGSVNRVLTTISKILSSIPASSPASM